MKSSVVPWEAEEVSGFRDRESKRSCDNQSRVERIFDKAIADADSREDERTTAVANEVTR